MLILSDLDAVIAARSLLQHPFYLRWSRGELTIEDMRIYAKEYFHLVQNIPGIVSQLAERIDDPQLKARIEQNAEEETEHVDLWRRFALSVGVDGDQLDAYVPSNKVQHAVLMLRQESAKGTEEGIAVMYALECELPKIAATKKEGLARFYGLDSADAQAYFDEHLHEEEHLKVWREFSLDEVTAQSAAQTSLDAQHFVLDAVCECAGISLAC